MWQQPRLHHPKWIMHRLLVITLSLLICIANGLEIQQHRVSLNTLLPLGAKYQIQCFIFLITWSMNANGCNSPTCKGRSSPPPKLLLTNVKRSMHTFRYSFCSYAYLTMCVSHSNGFSKISATQVNVRCWNCFPALFWHKWTGCVINTRISTARSIASTICRMFCCNFFNKFWFLYIFFLKFILGSYFLCN